jgi:hypothetical protein
VLIHCSFHQLDENKKNKYLKRISQDGVYAPDGYGDNIVPLPLSGLSGAACKIP